MGEFHVTDRLSELLDNELSAIDRQIVHTHLETCSSCKQVYEDLAFLSKSIGSEWTLYEAPQFLPERIALQIEEARLVRRQERSALAVLFSAFLGILLSSYWIFSHWMMFESKFLNLLIHVVFKTLQAGHSVVTFYPGFLQQIVAAGIAVLGAGIWSLNRMMRKFATSG